MEGQFVLLGYYPAGECVIDTHWVRARETTVYCPNGWTRPRMEATLRLIEQGQMKVKELVTHELPFTQAPEVYRLIQEKQADFLGIVFNWRV
jgi:threonine dehydrogenase-like Zn-dependent dehydrogenase